MLQVSGFNKYCQLSTSSKAKNHLDFPIVYPPTKSNLDVSSLLSYSISLKCCLWVTKDGRAFAIGSNQNYQIIGTLPKQIIDKKMEIKLTDQNGRPYKFLSALSGGRFSMYLISQTDGVSNSQVAYVVSGFNNGVPLFLKLGNRNPVSLFGYDENAAIVDSEGGIFIVTNSVLKSPEKELKRLILPKGEKTVYVAFLKNDCIALSSTGKVYEANFSTANINFSVVKELKDQKIEQISCFDRHCFAITTSGQIFGKGSNESGQLALSEKITNVEKFTEITALGKLGIVSAYAGNDFSLYRTSVGKIYGSGANVCGELLLAKSPGDYTTFTPIETTVVKDASFCITGSWMSAFFINCNPPPNCPNLKILDQDTANKILDESKDLKSQLRMKQIEIYDLQNQQETLLSKIKSLENQVNANKEGQKAKEVKELMKKETEYLQKIQLLDDQIKKQQKENEKKSKEINDFKQNEWNYISQIELLKKQIDDQKNEIEKKSKEINDFKQNEWNYISQIELLKKQIDDQKNEIESKSKEINELEQQIENNLHEIKLLNKENEISDNKEIQSLNEQLIFQKNENNKIIKENNELQQQNKNYLMQIESLKNANINNNENTETQHLKEQINDLKQNEWNYLKEIDSLKEQIQQQIKQNEKQKKEINELKKNGNNGIKNQLQEIGDVRKQLLKLSNEKEKQIKELQSQIGILNEQLRQKSKEIEKKEKKRKSSEFEELMMQHLNQNSSKSKDKKNASEAEKFRQKEIEYIQEIQSLKNQISQMFDPQASLQKQKIEIFDGDEINKMKILQSIGRGATSEVFKVSRDQIFALKVLYQSTTILEETNNVNDDDDEEDDSDENKENQHIDLEKIKRFLHEYELLHQINHPNIIKVYGISFGDQKHQPSILFEYCPYNLKVCIKILKKKERIKIITQICEAMKHIHSMKIIHRDLKPENILLDENKNVKISDFGLSSQIDSDSVSCDFGGTLKYMAPEIIKEINYNEKVDVYSFGVILYMILTKGEYPKMSLADVINGKKAEIPMTISRFSNELISKCWSQDSDERPSFAEILSLIRQNQLNIM